MEPIGVASDVVSLETLPRWSSLPVPDYDKSHFKDTSTPTPFTCDPSINEKVVIWMGDLSLLDTTAIVVTTNETFTEKNRLVDRVNRRAGSKLLTECRNHLRVCRTGEAKLTEGHSLAARHVIFTVGPRYNVRYQTAAESALYSCYRNVLQLFREHNMSTLGLCTVHSARRGYPPAEGAHITLRTIRRFLEKYGATVETIVLCMEDTTIEAVYMKLMPLYFPRDDDETRHSATNLPADVGNEDGEPVVVDRQVRITGKPEYKGAVDVGEEADPDDADNDDDADYRELLQCSVSIGETSFAKMRGDHDRVRRQSLRHQSDAADVWAEQQIRYERLLRRARMEDYSSLEAQHFLYQCGVDRYGRHIVVCVARNYAASKTDFDRVILFFVSLLNSVANRRYIIVYFSSLAEPDNMPEWLLMRRLYVCLSQKYRKNLGGLYVVHPTFWSKMVTWYQTTFNFAEIKDKVQLLGGVEYLYHFVDPQEIVVPNFVLDYDFKVNGRGYSVPYPTQDLPNPVPNDAL